MVICLIQRVDTQERAVQATPSPTDIASSVPMERHEKVLREMIRLKFTVQELSHKQGVNYREIMVGIEYSLVFGECPLTAKH